jgi:hypothetical protein
MYYRWGAVVAVALLNMRSHAADKVLIMLAADENKDAGPAFDVDIAENIVEPLDGLMLLRKRPSLSCLYHGRYDVNAMAAAHRPIVIISPSKKLILSPKDPRNPDLKREPL